MIPIRPFGMRMGERHLQLVHSLQKHPLPFVLQILETGFFRYQIGVTDDASDEETIVRHFFTLDALSFAQIQMHLLIGRGQCFQVVVAHAAQLDLECARRFQVAVDLVLFEIVTGTVREELRRLFVFERTKRYAANTPAHQLVFVAYEKAAEYFAHCGVVVLAFVFDAHVQDVDGLVGAGRVFGTGSAEKQDILLDE